ncbi:hypothetical protein SAMN05443245_6852 [Paraburkholderia fungorum]|uniref:Lysozyme inhibitor LprI N-terminal domain-containing protein n=1 Tax=Paraburkholderia fungorum TaxID=134537 RepID=A0A1H1JMG1_9BURK|nr:hypothetical protein [Paraburkholderia fungorum]SDR51173.1 hypothetical protein SAMN05443245_6852 [Paraburkholderia fungorum]
MFDPSHGVASARHTRSPRASMMQLTKVSLALLLACASCATYADANCEAKAKTHDDFLACTSADTKNILNDAEKFYQNLHAKLKGDNLAELEKNHDLWSEKLQSDCKLFGMAFSDWTGNYMPDTDFQVAACRQDTAKQKLEFYKWLTCSDDMESSEHPECSKVNRILGRTK